MVLRNLKGTVLKGMAVETVGTANYGKNPYNYTRVRIAKGREQEALARLYLSADIVRNENNDRYYFKTGVFPIAYWEYEWGQRLVVYMNTIEMIDRQLETDHG